MLDPARPSSLIDIRRARAARHDSIEVVLLVALAIGFVALLIWTVPR